MLLGGAKVVGVVAGPKLSSGVAAGRDREKVETPIAPGVKLQGLKESYGEVGAPQKELVPDRHRADETTRAARLGGAQAEEPHHIGQVAVIGQLRRGAVAADARVAI